MHRWIATLGLILAVSACGRLDGCAAGTTDSPAPGAAAGSAEAPRPSTAAGAKAREMVERWSQMDRHQRIEELRRTLRRAPGADRAGSLEADYDACDAKTRAHPNYEKATPGQRYLYFMACMLEQGWEAVERG